MYIKNLIKRTTYSILDLISEDCLEKVNRKFNTYYHKRKHTSEVNIAAESNSFEEYRRIMQEIPKEKANIK